MDWPGLRVNGRRNFCWVVPTKSALPIKAGFSPLARLSLLGLGLGLGLGLVDLGGVTGATPALGREPCNRQRTVERPNPSNPGAVRYICRHDLENNDDQVNEYYTYRASNLDGKRWQHQDQFRRRSLLLNYYYGEIQADGGWQWQLIERYDAGDYSREGEIKTRQYAQRSTNGAWQQEYQWRTRPNGPLNRCYAQSALAPDGGRRQALEQCTIDNRPANAQAAPIRLRNPNFRKHQDF